MSYILEALKKDEAASDPAAAAALALARTTPKRPWALWVVGAALMVNAAVLGYLFYPRSSSSGTELGRSGQPLSSPTATRQVAVRPRQRVAPPGQQSKSGSQSVPISSRPTPRPAAARTPSTAAAPTPAPAPETAVALSGTTAAPAAAPTSGRVLSPEEAAALNLLPPDGPAEVASVQTPDLQPGETLIGPGQRQAAEPSKSAAAAASTERGKRIIQLAELPPADRQDFPKLEFSTHIFADDPALRAVVVNSRRLNEGESIGEMVLRAVTEDGILVDYRGYRVAVSVIEEWN